MWKGVKLVWHAIIVVVRIGVVAEPGTVCVAPLSRMHGESIFFVRDPVAINIWIRVVSKPVAISIYLLTAVPGESILIVRHAVAVDAAQRRERASDGQVVGHTQQARPYSGSTLSPIPSRSKSPVSVGS